MKYRGVYISFTEDCDDNLGGYYCQVYSDEELQNQIDDFCIHPDELATNPDVEYWIRQNVDGQYYCYENCITGTDIEAPAQGMSLEVSY